MFNVEVLSKFPVVQHFPFGTFFRWETDPRVELPAVSPHVGAQPQRAAIPDSGISQYSSRNQPSLGAPRSNDTGRPVARPIAGTAAPWAQSTRAAPRTTMAAPNISYGRVPTSSNHMPMMPTTAPPRHAANAARQQQMQSPALAPGQNTKQG